MALPSPQRGFAIKGVPLALIENYATGALIARIEKAESAVLTTNFPSTPIYGGNPLYPHDFIDGDRTAQLVITTTRYQYGLEEAALGAEVTEEATITIPVIGELQAIPATTTYTVTLKNATAAIENSVKAYYVDTGVLLTQDETPAAGKYSYSNGILTFVEADAGKNIVIDYEYTATTAVLVAVLTNGRVPVVRIKLVNDFSNQDNVMMRQAKIVHKCRAGGSFEDNQSRGNAGKPSLTFDLMDPERPDGQLYSNAYIAL